MPNPMTGKVPGAKKKKRKQQKKPEEETGDQIDLSTLIYHTQSPVRLTDRSNVLCLKLGSLRLNRLPTNSLMDDLDYINSLTRPKFLETIGQLDRLVTTTNLPASLVLDACVRRFAYVSSDSREPDWPMADLDTVPWTATIHDLHSALLRVMVSQTTTTARRPLAHLIRKCLPRRSAGRKFDSVITKYMKASKLVETTIYSLLMASLMGHYTHSSGHLSLHARMSVHQWFDPTPVNADDTTQRTRMRENLMKWCPALFVFAVRDHLIHLLEDDPATRKHFDARYDYGQFRSITMEAIAAVRQYFEINLKLGGTLTADYSMPVVGDPTCKRELCKIFARVHTKMLRIQAVPASVSLFEFLGCLRGQVPNRSALVQKQAEIHLDEKEMVHGLDSLNIEEEDFDDDAMDSDDDDNKKDDVPEPDVEAHHYRLFEKFDDIKSLDQLIKEIPEPEEDKKLEVPQGVVRLTKQGITFAHSRAWHALMARMPPSTSPDTMFEFVLDMLPFFGVDPQALVELRKIWVRYKIGGPTLKAWRAEFTQFSAQYPTTWCNIIGAWVARCAHASAQLFLLDWCTSHYQVEAISSRFKCPKESLPDTAASLCVCTVCREIRSLVREPLTASVKQSYTYGLDKVGVNLFSRQVSCRKSKAFMHMQCHTQTPGRVNLLKCVLMYRRKLYLHCPQPNCGYTFRFSAIHCAFSPRGPACPECSLNMIRSTNIKLRKAHPFAVEQKLVCFLCNKRISKPTNGFIFAKDTVVCANAKHRLKELVDYVRANVPHATLMRRYESDIAAQVVRQVMLKLREETKSVWAQHNSRKNNAILRQSKKNKWTRAHMG